MAHMGSEGWGLNQVGSMRAPTEEEDKQELEPGSVG
jgi:hypothetical protein